MATVICLFTFVTLGTHSVHMPPGACLSFQRMQQQRLCKSVEVNLAAHKCLNDELIRNRGFLCMADGILEVADSAQKARKEEGILASYWQVSSSLSDPYSIIMHNCFHTFVSFRLIEGNI